ncbi:polysaccharide biosynthesis protein [Nitrincola tapanii]|uniref:Polysaccharide biosynthesis protein n=1 Tax=Nitrincola tapanii TaxID=1708751 RepID=A0A5A9W6C4_9GAMM|nr:nucleoside-diphosphate sugar epimerase/dehydratase [Nitrincola tapanii]KAA0875755.1 polysaccharide biosynthesis protein [Nitrincola tapanii]
MSIPAFLLNLPRVHKRWISVCADVVILLGAASLAVSIRMGDWFWPLGDYIWAVLLLPVLAIPVFITQGLYRAVIRYIGIKFANTVFFSVAAVFTLWTAAIFMLDLAYPRSAIVITWLLALLMIAVTRFFARRLLFMHNTSRAIKSQRKKVVIFGAGSAGRQLFQAIMKIPEVYVVGFVDDDKDLQGQIISAARVFSREQFSDLLAKYNVTDVYLAIPSIGISKRREIVDWLEPYPVRVSTIPGVDEIISGKVSFSDIREVDIADLLGRDPVAPREELLNRCVLNQVVMVTGAGGSIGSELCRQIIKHKPSTLILFELSEFALYSIEFELRQAILAGESDVQLIPILGSVQDAEHLQSVMQRYGVETIYHAAAYKHVPLVEYNMVAGLKNNVFGTLNTAEAAIRCGVKNFVLISTDKAVRPTNTMGASKRLAEMVLQALSERELKKGNAIRFAMVRFGNVLGSSGSVIPLFRKQIKAGGPITVTHPEITRYFMTIPEAAELVIQAGSMGSSGDVFVLDMGEPVKIVDLARKMIQLAGCEVRDEKNPNGDIEIVFTGLRPGEKTYEELLIGGVVKQTDHPMIMCASEEMLSWPMLQEVLSRLQQAMDNLDHPQLRNLLNEVVSGYRAESAIVDLLKPASVNLSRLKLA